jgi:hypothetical protein
LAVKSFPQFPQFNLWKTPENLNFFHKTADFSKKSKENASFFGEGYISLKDA